jgi:kinesin family protein 15
MELELTKKHDDINNECKAVEFQEQGEAGLYNLSDAQIELKTLVDAISSASQREAEAHETAIGLAKENEELRMQLKVLIEDNKRLFDLYEHAILNVEANQDGNCPTIPQNEHASVQQGSHPFGENLVNADLPNTPPAGPSDLHVHNSSSMKEESKVADEKYVNEDYLSRNTSAELRLQLEEMHEENDRLMGLYEKAMQERDEYKRKVLEQSNSETVKETQSDEKDDEMSESADCKNLEVKHVNGSTILASEEVLQLVRTKLELVQDKVVSAEDAVKYFELLERVSTKAEELSASIQLRRLDVQHGQEETNALKSALSESQDKKDIFEGKYFLPAASCWNLDLKTKAITSSKFDSNFALMNVKKEQLNLLQTRKNQLSAMRTRACESETELRSKIDGLKLKLRSYEAQRKEEEKVLFAIDNLDTSASMHKPKNFSKATDLLKFEEERIKLSCELQNAREQLRIVHKEIKSMQKCDYDCEIALLETEIEDCCLSLLEADIEKFVRDNTLTEVWEGEAKNMDALLIDYQDCVFHVNLKEEEIKVCEESLQHQARGLDELHLKLNQAMWELGELLHDRRSLTSCSLDQSMLPVGEKVATDLEAVRIHVAEAKQLLLLDSQSVNLHD